MVQVAMGPKFLTDMHCGNGVTKIVDISQNLDDSAHGILLRWWRIR